MIPPWHLWGNTATVNLAVTGAANPITQSSLQLARVNYGRPASWRFFMAATLIDIQGPVLAGTLVTVNYQVSFGTGRSVNTVDQFVFFEFDPAGAPPFYALPDTRFAGSAFEPLRVATRPTIGTTKIEVIPADSIQCNAIVTLQPGNAGSYTAVVEASAYFAPENHIRPEWFEDPPRMPGKENHGR